jgi:hypothetical protein
MLTIALISIISVSLFVAIEWFNNERQSIPEFFVGVEFAYGNVSDCKDLVDKVKNYTNLFAIGSLDISLNQIWLNATCDYAYDAGLSFIVLFTGHTEYLYNPYVWTIKARQKYGDRFLGAYCIDEPGGKQLNNSTFRLVLEAKNYTDAAQNYVKYLYYHLGCWIYIGARVFTADYGLYWFDYKGGHDVVLAEFGWNHSRQLNIALCRGAARVQNKEWGAMITWTYYNPPYIESGEELYNDMILAYHAGAKYVLVFDYPQIVRYGILTEEHFSAMKKFWNYIHGSPENYGIDEEVAYVLPEDYGFGFRNPNDTIWGLWKADESSKKIWDDVNNLLDRYGSRLDIVYSDPEFNNAIKSRYNKLIFWNETAT